MSGASADFSAWKSLNGGQPTPDGAGLEIYFRGYLSNQEDLAEALGIQGAIGSVVELIARAYRRWRRALPSKLEGQFALAVADSATGEILIARDPLGVVPLYWSLKGQRIGFASRIADLVDGGMPPELNRKEIERYILFGGGAASDATCYASIKRLPAGTSVWVQKGRVSTDRLWNPEGLSPLRYKRSSDYIEHFIELVGRSVDGALQGSSSPWIALSGGLDSNTILAPAHRYRPNLQAYSIIAPQWPEEDESRWIERIVATRGIAWTAINAEDVLPFSMSPAGFCGSPDAVILYGKLYSQLNGLVGTDVMLTGDGGDSFMGSQMGPIPSHLADPLFSGDFLGVVSNLRQWAKQSSPARPIGHWVLQGAVLPAIRHILRRSARRAHYHLHPTWLRIGKPLLSRSRAAQPEAVAPRCKTPGHQALLDDLWQCAEDTTALVKSYSNRHPLFDRRLYEYLWRIPWSQKLIPGCDRYLQRRALKGIVDDDIRTRLSYGMGSRCFAEGLRRSPEWQDYLRDDPALAAMGIVDTAEWQRAVQQACLGQTNAEPLFFRAITTEVWLKQLAVLKHKSNSQTTFAVANG